MIYSLGIIVVILAVLWAKKRYASLPEKDRAATLKNWVLIGGAGLIFLLVATGRAPWVMGVLAALMAVAGRLMQLASYIPVFKGIFSKASASESKEGDQMASSAAMTKAQAAEILGVEVDATPEQIRTAHKRLMQKMHPDRGGSEILAKHINRAKEVLLGRHSGD